MPAVGSAPRALARAWARAVAVAVGSDRRRIARDDHAPRLAPTRRTRIVAERGGGLHADDAVQEE